jgi:hypothetical protein
MKKPALIASTLVALVVSLILAEIVFGQRVARDSAVYAGGGWEYLVVSGGTVNLSATDHDSMRKEPTVAAFREAFPVEENLDKLGAKGWQLVSVEASPKGPMYYFKREK